MRIRHLVPRRGAALGALGAVLLSCGLINPNVLDTDIRLQRQVYSQDFGTATGKVPGPVPCSAQTDVCKQITDAVQGASAHGVCDTAAMRCYAQATTTLPYSVNLSQDQAFQSGVAGRVVQFVRAVELGYSLVNSVTFDIPQIEIYIGPQDAKNKTDPGVVPVGTIGPFTRMQSISDTAPMKLTIADGSPARTQLESYIKNPKVPFVFLISATARIDSGSDLPAGKLELHVFPKITVGLPR